MLRGVFKPDGCRTARNTGVYVRFLCCAVILGLCALAWGGSLVTTSGDVDGDGLDDIAIAAGNGFLQTVHAVGDGTFRSGRIIRLDAGTPVDVVMGDLTVDGQLDTLVGYADTGGFTIDTSAHFILRSYGHGAGLSRMVTGHFDGLTPRVFASFDASAEGTLLRYDTTSRQLWPVHSLEYDGQVVLDTSVLDYDEDGAEELAVLYATGLAIYSYDAAAGFQIESEWELDLESDTRLLPASLLEPGKAEVAMWSPGNAQITLLKRNTPTGWVRLSQDLEATPGEMAGSDFDEDGDTDLFGITASGDTIFYLHNAGDMRFSVSTATLPFSSDTVAVIPGTFSHSLPGFAVIGTTPEGRLTALFVPISGGVLGTAISTQVPQPHAGAAAYASVVIRDATNPDLVYWSERIPDWTVDATLISNHLVVKREEDMGSGLAPAADVTLLSLKTPIWATAVEAVPNQIADDRSIFHLQAPLPVTALPTLASPGGGTYARTVRVVLESRDEASLFYRKDGGAWEAYDPDGSPLYFHRSGTLEAYATYLGFTGASLQTAYVIEQDYDADSDFDGVPDFVENELGMNPLDGDLDSDDDGWDDLDELVRDTDPLEAESLPKDSDAPTDAEREAGVFGDGWADFDETFRETDTDDPESKPVVTGLEIPEAIVPLTVSESSLATASGTENSRLEAVLLSGGGLASSTLDADPSLRVPVDQPLVIRYTDFADPEVMLLDYVPRHTFDPNIEGDESTTAEKWIDAYQAEVLTELFETRSSSVFDAESTASVLALGRFFERTFSLSAPCILSEASGTPTLSDLRTLEQSVDLDEVVEYLDDTIPSTTLPNLVRAYVSWAQDEDIWGNVVQSLAWALYGWDRGSGPDGLPTKVNAKQSAIDLTPIRAELDSILDSVPTHNVSLEGVLAWDDRGFASIDDSDVPYGLEGAGVILPIGSTVRVEGRAVIPSPFEETVWIEILQVEIIEDTPRGTAVDTDADSLADQWERFYFADTSVTAEDDADGDGSTNGQEYNGYSDPTDPLSLPLPGTAVPNWWEHSARLGR